MAKKPVASKPEGDEEASGPRSLVGVLARFASENGVGAGDVEIEEADASAAAVYLKPYLDNLATLNEKVKPFPTSPRAGPWSAIENEVLDPDCNESVLQVGERHGMSKNHIYRMSGRRLWKERRQVILEIHARQSVAGTLVSTGRVVAPRRKRLSREAYEKRVLGLIDRSLEVFERGLESGQVVFKSAKDLDVLVRLAKYVQGEADKIIERRDRVTPEMLMRRTRAIAKSLNLDEQLAGIVPIREAEFTTPSEAMAPPGSGDGDDYKGNGASASTDTEPPSRASFDDAFAGEDDPISAEAEAGAELEEGVADDVSGDDDTSAAGDEPAS